MARADAILAALGLAVGVALGWVPGVEPQGFDWTGVLLLVALVALAVAIRIIELAMSLPEDVGQRRKSENSESPVDKEILVSLLDTYRSVFRLKRGWASWRLGSMAAFAGVVLCMFGRVLFAQFPAPRAEQGPSSFPWGDIAVVLGVVFGMAVFLGLILAILVVLVRPVRWRPIATPALLLALTIAIGLAGRWAFFTGAGIRWTDNWSLSASVLRFAFPAVVFLFLFTGAFVYVLKSLPLGVAWSVVSGLGCLSIAVALLLPMVAAYSAGSNSSIGYVTNDSKYPVHCLSLTTPLVLEGRVVEGVLEIETGHDRAWVRIPPIQPSGTEDLPAEWELALVSTSQLTGAKVECEQLRPQSGSHG